MTRLRNAVLTMVCVLTLAGLAASQSRDPLTDAESDQLREMAQEPLKRFKLLIKFATERLNVLDQVRNDAKSKDRGQRVHDALTDFRQIIDELDDNIDDYSEKRTDLRKPLKEVVDAEGGFQSRLQGLKDASLKQTDPAEYQRYNFALQDALESVSLSLEDAKKTLDEQTEAFKEVKKK
jgi:hypothetical protein